MRCSRTCSPTPGLRTSTSRRSAISAARSARRCWSVGRRNVRGAVSQPVVHLSSVLRSPLLDRAGERLGRVEDLIVRLADGGYPPVTGVKARIGGRELFVPIGMIASLQPGAARLAGQTLSL